MKKKLKFIKGECYTHKNFKDVMIRILKKISDKTFTVEYFSLGRQGNKSLGTFNIFFHDGDKDWEIYDDV